MYITGHEIYRKQTVREDHLYHYYSESDSNGSRI